jgi:hypothetical protein
LKSAVTITLHSEQEELLQEAIDAGLAHTREEALASAFDALRQSLAKTSLPEPESSAEAILRLASFGKRHGLSLGETTVKELLAESRP